VTDINITNLPRNSGPSRSLGNPLSIQVPALVKIASKIGKLFLFSDDRDGGKQEWTQCHIRDTTALYKLIIDKTFSNETIESGVYFAENGFFKWDRLYELVTDVLGLPNALAEPSQEDVNQMAGILSVRPNEVATQISGRQVLPCDLDRSDRGSADYRGLYNSRRVIAQGRRARKLGWKPKYTVTDMWDNLEHDIKLVASHSYSC
jgi:hypothetical protein